MNSLELIFTFMLMIIIFYFLIYRPQKKQQKRQQDLLLKIEIGQMIETFGGLIGVIISIEKTDNGEERFLIQSNESKILIKREVVSNILEQE